MTDLEPRLTRTQTSEWLSLSVSSRCFSSYSESGGGICHRESGDGCGRGVGCCCGCGDTPDLCPVAGAATAVAAAFKIICDRGRVTGRPTKLDGLPAPSSKVNLEPLLALLRTATTLVPHPLIEVELFAVVRAPRARCGPVRTAFHQLGILEELIGSR